MAITIELQDGVDTIDLTNSTYGVSGFTFPAPVVDAVIAGTSLRGAKYRPRRVSFPLVLNGSNVADLRAKLRDLEAMLRRAEFRQTVGVGTPVTLHLQTGNTDADDIKYRVLRGDVVLPSGVFAEPGVTNSQMTGTVLNLLVEPFGRMAQSTGSQLNLRNELFGETEDVLKIDVSAVIDSPHGARLQLKVQDSASTWNGTKKMWISKRSGERVTDTLFFQGEAETSLVESSNPFGADKGFWSSDGNLSVASASGGAVSEMRWTLVQAQTVSYNTGYFHLGYAEYQIAGGNIPSGLFRVLVRAEIHLPNVDLLTKDDVGIALGWGFGEVSKTPVVGDEVNVGTLDQYETLDLGELVLPPTGVADNFTAPTFKLRIYWTSNDSNGQNVIQNNQMYLRIDYIMLIPADEGLVIVDSIATADRILIDNISDSPGVFILNSSDVVQKAATFTGSPFDVGPEDTRIYVVRDDTGDPTGVISALIPTYEPKTTGL